MADYVMEYLRVAKEKNKRLYFAAANDEKAIERARELFQSRNIRSGGELVGVYRTPKNLLKKVE